MIPQSRVELIGHCCVCGEQKRSNSDWLEAKEIVLDDSSSLLFSMIATPRSNTSLVCGDGCAVQLLQTWLNERRGSKSSLTNAKQS